MPRKKTTTSRRKTTTRKKEVKPAESRPAPATDPAEETVAKAREESIPLLGCELTTFDVVAKLAALGIVGG